MTPGKLWLAPLQGVTDAIVRDLITALGGVDGCLSVYARVSHRPLPEGPLLRTCPEAARGGTTVAGSPVVLQLLGSDADSLAETARRAVDIGAPAIDLNFGCPMGRVNRNDGGAKLLQHPARIEGIVRAVRQAVPPSVGLSAKVRTGWADASEVEGIVRAVEQGGACWVTVHGRTRAQQYGGHADWDAIARARLAVRIPVIANGDIRGPEDLARCARQTGCQHFMIGRGALARPELFRVLSKRQDGWWSPSDRLALLSSFGQRALALGMPEPTVVGRVKGWWRYMGEADEGIAAAFAASRRRSSWPEVHEALCQGTDR